MDSTGKFLVNVGKSEFVLALKKDPVSNKHKFEAVTGLSNEEKSKLKNITPLLHQLVQTTQGK
jgi:flagellar biogenesis protein FliO